MLQEKQWDMLTYGETMLRLSPPAFARLEDAASLDMRIGGSESNVAAALARLGKKTAWGSKLPDNQLGQRVVSELRRWGVDTSPAHVSSENSARVGIYFLDFGVPPRSTEVLYDRAASAASTLSPHDVNPQHIAAARLLHLSGITPALSPSCAEFTAHAMQIARSENIPVSFDVNYRAKLWTPEEAARCLTPLLHRLDLLICTSEDALLLFEAGGSGLQQAYALQQSFEAQRVVITCGAQGAAAVWQQQEMEEPGYALSQIVDRVGAGDAFAAGVLYGMLEENATLGLQMAVAMAALKHSMPGDMLIASHAEIISAMKRSAGGIRR